MKSLKFDTKLFSSFRGCLMGIAILGVLLLHAFAWTGSEHLYLSKILGPLGRTVFTEGLYSFRDSDYIIVLVIIIIYMSFIKDVLRGFLSHL